MIEKGLEWIKVVEEPVTSSFINYNSGSTIQQNNQHIEKTQDSSPFGSSIGPSPDYIKETGNCVQGPH